MSEVRTMREYLSRWRNKYGEDRIGRHGNSYKQIPIDTRDQLIIRFLRWMKMLGFEKEYFMTSNFEALLIKNCFGPDPDTEPEKKKRKKGHEAVKEELFWILTNEKPFGKPSSGKKGKRISKNIEKIKQKRKEKEITKTEEARKEYDMYKDTVDPSILKDLPKPEVVWDDDLEKELGGK